MTAPFLPPMTAPRMAPTTALAPTFDAAPVVGDSPSRKMVSV